MHVYDKYGNPKTLTWLYDQFGPLEIAAESDELRPLYEVYALIEADDLDKANAGPRTSRTEAAAAINVLVLDKGGAPVPGQTVVFWWPDAPKLPGAGHHGRGVTARTGDDGCASFAMGRGAYYDPAAIRGPHDVWLLGPGTSERVSGLGMIAGTNHRHLNVTFQTAPDVRPPIVPPEPVAELANLLTSAAVAIAKALALLGAE